MKLWFGYEHGPDDPSPDEIRDVAARLRGLAADHGIPRGDYVEELHDAAFDEAELAVEEAENDAERVLIDRLKLADELREAARSIRERAALLSDPGEAPDLAERLDAEADDAARRVEDAARRLAPNLSDLATPLLAARLVDLAGGLEDLARRPASTVQVLGAETALFRHLATGAPPPKHGILYSHPDVQAADERRGEVARALAAKLAIAARVDAYGGRDRSEELREEWEERLEEVGR